jgi:5-methylcytosine-specific restriction endonuclease McrA
MIDRRSLSQAKRNEIVARQNGLCAMCHRPLVPGHFEFDHIQALEHDGDNAPDNWRALCFSPCHKLKTKADHHGRAKRDRLAVGGRQRRGPPLMGSKASGWRKPMFGPPERRT